MRKNSDFPKQAALSRRELLRQGIQTLGGVGLVAFGLPLGPNGHAQANPPDPRIRLEGIDVHTYQYMQTLVSPSCLLPGCWLPRYGPRLFVD